MASVLDQTQGLVPGPRSLCPRRYFRFTACPLQAIRKRFFLPFARDLTVPTKDSFKEEEPIPDLCIICSIELRSRPCRLHFWKPTALFKDCEIRFLLPDMWRSIDLSRKTLVGFVFYNCLFRNLSSSQDVTLPDRGGNMDIRASGTAATKANSTRTVSKTEQNEYRFL